MLCAGDWGLGDPWVISQLCHKLLLLPAALAIRVLLLPPRPLHTLPPQSCEKASKAMAQLKPSAVWDEGVREGPSGQHDRRKRVRLAVVAGEASQRAEPSQEGTSLLRVC